jgi:hypothetical protein
MDTGCTEKPKTQLIGLNWRQIPNFALERYGRDIPLPDLLHLIGASCPKIDRLGRAKRGAAGIGKRRGSAMPPRPDWPEAGWKILQEDALAFLGEWACQAHRLGWDALSLFSVHAEAPLARLDGMALVPMLGGRPVVAITEDSAVIKANSGGTRTFRRHRAWPPGRCLIWEL